MSSRPAVETELEQLPDAEPEAVASMDQESAAWLSALRATGAQREEAVRSLHELLLRAARFEMARRRSTLTHLAHTEIQDLTVQAANDACTSVLTRLETFRGLSRFTTWAYKFAIYETSVKARSRSWQDREVPLEPQSWALLPDENAGPEDSAQYGELLGAVRQGIEMALTSHQRRVLVALTITGVPIDVLAQRLGTTRGALYKTLHDARRKLRAYLEDQGLAPAGLPAGKEF